MNLVSLQRAQVKPCLAAARVFLHDIHLEVQMLVIKDRPARMRYQCRKQLR